MTSASPPSFADHLTETESHVAADRGAPRGARREAVELSGRGDAARRAQPRRVLRAQPDTTAKLAGFAFAFEHLEIAAYELLRRIAERAADAETVVVAQSILVEERAAADEVSELWDHVLDAELTEQGVAG